MMDEPLTHESFVKSLPWTWTLLQPDQSRNDLEAAGAPLHGNRDPNRLSAAESLCLGRCHAAHQVSRDTVMLVFGSSKPSSNGILGYDLSCDEFRRPRVTGCLPQGRLCFASAFLPRLGAIIVHSGWSTQVDGVIDDGTDTNMALLQLAPATHRRDTLRNQCLPSAVAPDPVPAPPVTDEHVRTARQQRFFGHVGMQMLVMSLFEEGDPQQAAQEWLENRGPWSEPQTIVLQMIADGHVQMRVVNQDDSDSEIDLDEDDNDGEENDDDNDDDLLQNARS